MGEKGPIHSYRDLEVYKMAMDGAVRIYELTKTFPPEERFSLVDQIRRCSRSVCANIGEAWSPTRRVPRWRPTAKGNDAVFCLPSA
jgi:hypothetical protein